MPDVIRILCEVLREPALPADQFDLIQRERLAALEQMRTEPAMLAPRMLQRELSPYPKEDIRYQPTIDEALERLRTMNREQVAQLYHDFLGSQAGELTLVGDFDAEACLAPLKDSLKNWTASKPYARIPLPIVKEPVGAEHKINTPDKANATYVAGTIFPLRDDDPDFAPMVIANYIFGGGTLSSRLGNRIRQQDGLSYGVTSSFTASSIEKRATFGITAICNPQNIDHLAKDVQEELDRFVKDGVTPEELEKAKQGYLQARKVARSSDAALAGTLSNLRHFGRTMEYEADLEKKIAGLTVEQVGAALRKNIDPKKLIIVTAGDFEQKATAAAPPP
jgi:zinc protease